MSLKQLLLGHSPTDYQDPISCDPESPHYAPGSFEYNIDFNGRVPKNCHTVSEQGQWIEVHRVDADGELVYRDGKLITDRLYGRVVVDRPPPKGRTPNVVPPDEATPQ